MFPNLKGQSIYVITRVTGVLALAEALYNI